MMLCMLTGHNHLDDFFHGSEYKFKGPNEALFLLMMKGWMVKYFFAMSMLIGNLMLAREYSRHATGEESFTTETLFLLSYASTVMTGWFILAVPLFCIAWGSEVVKDPLLKMIGVRVREEEESETLII
jgi:hypothetical protein